MTVDRTELRAWLEANCPPEMREPPGEDEICWGGRRFMFRSETQKLQGFDNERRNGVARTPTASPAR